MDIQKSAEIVQDQIRQRHQPAGHHHPGWWEYGYVGGSTIVGYTADEIAQEMTDDRNGIYKDDDVPSFYTYRGDTLHRESHHPDDGWVHDIEGRFPIPYEWQTAERDPFHLIIHPDSLRVHAGFLHVGEHKAFGKNYPEKQSKAYAQDALGASMLHGLIVAWFENDDPLDWHPLVDTGFVTRGEETVSLDEGDRQKFIRFYETHYAKGGFEPKEDTYIDIVQGEVDLDAVACHLTIVEDDPDWQNPDPFRDFVIIDRDDLDKIRGYYLKKAAIICEATDHKDPLIAYEKWDLQHPEEFSLNIEDPDTFFGEPPEVTVAGAKYEFAKEEAKKWEARKRKASGEAKTALQHMDVAKVEGDWGRVKLANGGTGRGVNVTAIDDVKAFIGDLVAEVDDPDTQDLLAEVRARLDDTIKPGRSYQYPSVEMKKEQLEGFLEDVEW